MFSPKISVIIPIFNAEKYLEKCLNSIINQTFDDIEIICVNDGSTDKSLDILNRFSKKDKRFKIFSTKNNGQGSARNFGLKKAAGEYVSFVDADDWISEDSFELLYEKAKSFDLDILFFQMINYINSTGSLVETELYNYSVFLNNLDINIPFSYVDIKDYLFQIAVCPVSKLYKKDFLDKNDLFFPENMIFEDNVFFYNAFLKAKRVSFLDEKLYYRRRHSESVTQNISKKSFDIILATNEMLKLFKSNNWYDEFKMDLINHTFSMILEWFFKVNIILSGDFFVKIKFESMALNELCVDFKNYLDDEKRIIHELFIKYDNYIDFMIYYKLAFADYKFIKENSNYLISVIIPIYNNEKFIHRTLHSIINQTIGFDNIEVILINDNSNDKTAEVIDNYSFIYDNIKTIHLKNNTGSAGTPRNIGIKESSANYLMFLDHDDFFELDALEKLYSRITETKSDLVFGTYVVIGKDLFKKVTYPNEKKGDFDSILDNERFVGYPPPSIWTKLFKKDVIIENNILFPTILGEDAIFMNKVLLKASGISYLADDIICYHDLSGESTTNCISFSYLFEGLISEKYLFNLFKSLNKEYYFRYRCEGNINFFLSQFLRSNLNKKEIREILPIYNWFLDKCTAYGLKPNNEKSDCLMKLFIKEDVDGIYNFINNSNEKVIFNYEELKKKSFLFLKKIKNRVF